LHIYHYHCRLRRVDRIDLHCRASSHWQVISAYGDERHSGESLPLWAGDAHVDELFVCPDATLGTGWFVPQAVTRRRPRAAVPCNQPRPMLADPFGQARSSYGEAWRKLRPSLAISQEIRISRKISP